MCAGKYTTILFYIYSLTHKYSSSDVCTGEEHLGCISKHSRKIDDGTEIETPAVHACIQDGGEGEKCCS